MAGDGGLFGDAVFVIKEAFRACRDDGESRDDDHGLGCRHADEFAAVRWLGFQTSGAAYDRKGICLWKTPDLKWDLF
jgi:hypothetical protein